MPVAAPQNPQQQQVPSVFYTAEIGFGGEPLREFSDTVRISGLCEARVFAGAVPGSWAAALRGTQLKVGPLNPADVAVMAGLSAAGAFDAALVTGGLPVICARWRHGEDTWFFLARELASPVSPLVVSARLSLAGASPIPR